MLASAHNFPYSQPLQKIERHGEKKPVIKCEEKGRERGKGIKLTQKQLLDQSEVSVPPSDA